VSLDPTGAVIKFIAADPGVAALTSHVHGQKEPKEAPKYVIVRRRSSTPAIAGPGTDRGPARSIDYVAFCYAPKNQQGLIDAAQLAGAVSDAIHLKGPLTFPAPGGSGHLGIYRMREDSTGDTLTDPITQEPYIPVLFSLIATATALA
jgi:hypothetical protein